MTETELRESLAAKERELQQARVTIDDLQLAVTVKDGSYRVAKHDRDVAQAEAAVMRSLLQTCKRYVGNLPLEGSLEVEFAIERALDSAAGSALLQRLADLERELAWFVKWVVDRGVSAPCGITDRVAAEIKEAREHIAAAEALLEKKG